MNSRDSEIRQKSSCPHLEPKHVHDGDDVPVAPDLPVAAAAAAAPLPGGGGGSLGGTHLVNPCYNPEKGKKIWRVKYLRNFLKNKNRTMRRAIRRAPWRWHPWHPEPCKEE